MNRKCKGCGNLFPVEKCGQVFCGPECKPSSAKSVMRLKGDCGMLALNKVAQDLTRCRLTLSGYKVSKPSEASRCHMLASKPDGKPVRVMARLTNRHPYQPIVLPLYRSDEAICDVVALVYGWDKIEFRDAKTCELINM